MKKVSMFFLPAILMLTMFSGNVFAMDSKAEESKAVSVSYRTQIENEGWAQGWVSNGDLSGSEGKGLRLEAIEIELTGNLPEGLGIQYQTHIQNRGWAQGWISNGELSGTVGESLRLEAIQIRLMGNAAGDYTVRYRTHIQNQGWAQGWVADGAISGSEGKGLRLEAIEIVIEETPVKIAYDKYLSVLDQVKEADYTIATWETYQKVVAANVVTKDNIPNKITEATLAIETAQKDLVKKADLAIYHDALDNVAESQCTPESWAVYQAIVDANVVTPEDSQTKVDAATIAILKAQKNLVRYSDLTAYNAAVAAVTEEQVRSGWAEYKTVLDNNVVTKLSTQIQVDEATANILAAQKKLVLYSDMTTFNEAIALYIKYGIDADNAPYSAETWHAYVADCDQYGTLTDGVWVYDVISKESDQTIIDDAAADINSYVAKLVKTSDLTAFNAAKNIKITDGPYTTTSFATYLNDPQVITITSLSADTLKSYSQSVVNAYTNTLIAIQSGILIKGADLTAYNNALAEVVQGNYTPGTWTAYEAVVSANMVTVDNTQATVNSATAKIRNAQKSLIYSAAYVISTARINSSNFEIQQVGDNILAAINQLIANAGIDKDKYTISFQQVDNANTGVIDPVTGEITEIGSSKATVIFTLTPIDGDISATTEVDFYINP